MPGSVIHNPIAEMCWHMIFEELSMANSMSSTGEHYDIWEADLKWITWVAQFHETRVWQINSVWWGLWWGFFVTNNWTLLIDPDKNTEEKRTPFRSGALVWCRPNTLEYENKYLYLRKTENIVCGVFTNNQKRTLSQSRSRLIFIPIGVVIDDASIPDLHNCIICTLWFSYTCPEQTAWLLGL